MPIASGPLIIYWERVSLDLTDRGGIRETIRFFIGLDYTIGFNPWPAWACVCVVGAGTWTKVLMRVAPRAKPRLSPAQRRHAAGQLVQAEATQGVQGRADLVAEAT